jgi:hypothetical protein
MYKVFIINESAPDHRRLVGSTDDPMVVAAAAGGMLASLPEFRGTELRQMVSRRRGALLAAIEGLNR